MKYVFWNMPVVAGCIFLLTILPAGHPFLVSFLATVPCVTSTLVGFELHKWMDKK